MRSGIFVILLGFLLGSGEFACAKDDTLTIARDKTIPGKHVFLGCDPFARALYKRLTDAGGEAYYIVYNWKSMDAGWMCHAFVVCRDGKGQYLGMDQNRGMPLLLPGKTPAEWIQWFNGPGEVQLVSSITNKKLAGQVADLSRVRGKEKKVSKEPKVNGKKSTGNNPNGRKEPAEKAGKI